MSKCSKLYLFIERKKICENLAIVSKHFMYTTPLEHLTQETEAHELKIDQKDAAEFSATHSSFTRAMRNPCPI